VRFRLSTLLAALVAFGCSAGEERGEVPRPPFECDYDESFHSDWFDDDDSGEPQTPNIVEIFNNTPHEVVSVRESTCGDSDWQEGELGIGSLQPCGQVEVWLEQGCRDLEVIDERDCLATDQVPYTSPSGLWFWEVTQAALLCN
jgi:hypothetical protein